MILDFRTKALNFAVTIGASLVLLFSVAPPCGADEGALELGRKQVYELDIGQKRYHRVSAGPGQFLRLVVSPVDFNLRATIRGPDGDSIREGRNRICGASSFSWKSEAGGNYVIEIRLPEGAGRGGKYEITLQEKREAHENDEIRIDAERAFSEAELLSEKGDLDAGRRAVEKYKQALIGWRKLGDEHEEGMTLINAGLIHYYQSEEQAAYDYFNQALRIYQKLGDQEGIAESFFNLAGVYADLGNLPKARETYQQALDSWQSLNHLKGQARSKIALAVIYFQLGEKQQAFDFYRQSLAIHRRLANFEGETAALNGLGYAYFEVGEDSNAIDAAKQALEVAEKQEARFAFLVPQIIAHATLALAYQRSGNLQQALVHAERELELSGKMQDPRQEAYALKHLGSVYQALGDKQKALDHYEKSMARHRAVQNKLEESATLNSIGYIHELNGDRQKALDCYLAALPISRETENRAEEVRALHNIAHVRRDMGDLDQARKRIEQAIELIESLRVRVGGRQLRESYFATVQKSYSLYLDVLMLLHKRKPAEGLNELALQVSEQARARSFREMLVESNADLRKDAPPRLFERERVLQQELNNKAARQQDLLGGAHTPEDAEKLARELRSIKLEYDEVQRQIRESAPRYAALTQPQPLAVKEIQRQLLDKDTALLEYALGDDRSYLWLVTTEKVVSFELPARSVIEKAALHAYELLVMRQSLNAGKPAEYEQRLQRIKKAEEQYWIEAVSLSRMLFSTVAEHLDKTRLVIVSDGALQYLPFTALPLLDQKTSAKQTALLIDKYEIVNLPSASTLADLRKGSAGRQPAPKLVAVVASPVFSFDDSRLTIAGGNKDQAGDLTADLLRAWRSSGGEKSIPPLPFSEKEGREIIKLAPPQSSLLAMGFDASRSLLESQRLGQYRFIHFATHGLLNSDHPELSGLILSLYSPEGERVDGFLRMHEIYNLKLQADLIVLSACQTGIGKEIKGEGLIGLTRGFMYAGASRVVASLWKVDDAATAALMQHYYRYLLQEKMSPAAALRQAQLKTMQQNLRWRSPFYWAAFVLQGEYR